MEHKLRLSTPKVEGILQVSKWLKYQVLLDSDEMQSLLSSLGPFSFFNVSQPVIESAAVFSQEQFLEEYRRYITLLKQGALPSPEEFRLPFSAALSKTADSLYVMQAGAEKVLVKPIQPVIQMQAHSFFYSNLDGKFHSMVQSADSISWGVQFSYPQLFQDPHSRLIIRVVSQEAFANTALFSALTQWMRSHTLPTPFVVKGIKTNSPMRIGKQAIKWVGSHPKLKEKGIEVQIVP